MSSNRDFPWAAMIVAAIVLAVIAMATVVIGLGIFLLAPSNSGPGPLPMVQATTAQRRATAVEIDWPGASAEELEQAVATSLAAIDTSGFDGWVLVSERNEASLYLFVAPQTTDQMLVQRREQLVDQLEPGLPVGAETKDAAQLDLLVDPNGWKERTAMRVTINLDHDKLAQFGITATDVQRVIAESGLAEGDDEETLAKVQELRITTPDGNVIPLQTIAEIELSEVSTVRVLRQP